MTAPTNGSGGGVNSIPEEIAAKVREIGRAEWGQTHAHDADGHGKHIAESVRLTAAHFGQTEDQHMHGLFVEGTETVICHTGTSPNSPEIARALTGAWNWLHDQATEATPPAQVGAATDSGEGVRMALRRVRDDWPARRSAAEWAGQPAAHIDDMLLGLIIYYDGFAEKTAEWFDREKVVASPTKPVADSVEAVEDDEPDVASEWRRLALQFDDHRMRALSHMRALLTDPSGYESKARAFLSEPPLSGEQVLADRLASMPSTDQEGLVGATSADAILYSIKHHLAVMGDTREGIECALADARSLVANLEARARQTGSEGA